MLARFRVFGRVEVGRSKVKEAIGV